MQLSLTTPGRSKVVTAVTMVGASNAEVTGGKGSESWLADMDDDFPAWNTCQIPASLMNWWIVAAGSQVKPSFHKQIQNLGRYMEKCINSSQKVTSKKTRVSHILWHSLTAVETLLHFSQFEQAPLAPISLHPQCNDTIKSFAIYSTRTTKKRNSSMNMFTYVHHKNQPPQVAGIPTNSRFFS